MSSENRKIFEKMLKEGVNAEIFNSRTNGAPVLRMIECETGITVEISVDGENVVNGDLVIDVFYMECRDYLEELDVCRTHFLQIEGLNAVRNCMARYDVREILFNEYCEIAVNYF